MTHKGAALASYSLTEVLRNLKNGIWQKSAPEGAETTVRHSPFLYVEFLRFPLYENEARCFVFSMSKKSGQAWLSCKDTQSFCIDHTFRRFFSSVIILSFGTGLNLRAKIKRTYAESLHRWQLFCSTMLKKINYPCIRHLILIFRYLREIIRVLSVSYPCIIRHQEQKLRSDGVSS